MSNFNSKSLLAKLMATENLYVEQANVPTASFDVMNRILTVPILDNNLSSDLYDLFIGHEVGHALYTPIKEMANAKEIGVHMSILNVCEDYRIEKKIKYKYPGLKNCFVKAYRELMEKDFFETKEKDLQLMNFIDRMNLHHKVGPILGIKFTDFERELISEVESAEKYSEVIEVAKKIHEYMKDELENLAQKQEKMNILVITDGEDEENGASGEDTGEKLEDFDVIIDARSGKSQENDERGEKMNSSGSSEETDEAEEGEIESEQQSAESDMHSNNQSEGGKSGSGYGRGVSRNTESGKVNPENLKSHTDEAYNRNQSKLYSTENSKMSYASIPKFDTSNIYDYKKLYKDYVEEGYTLSTKHFNKYKNEANKVVSYLVKEFELRKNAEQLKRASISKTGELNLNKVYSYNFNDDIFKRMSVIPEGKSHGLIMYLDWSGSMARHLGNTMKQLFNLAMFCRKVNIPFEVYAFIDETLEEYTCYMKHESGDLYCSKFGLFNLLSSRMSNRDFTIACSALMSIAGIGAHSRVGYGPPWMRLSGTPLNEAIISAMEIVPEFQQRNKLQIVNTVFLTDGEGSYLNSIYQNKLGEHTQGGFHRGRGYVVIRDRKTRHEEKYDLSDNVNMGQTNALVRLLKHRTNAHVIGFYVADTGEFKNKIRYLYNDVHHPDGLIDFDKVEKIKSDFVKNKFAISTNTGFDDYYILRGVSLDTDDDTELEIKQNATTRGMVSAFSKYAGNRLNNRVVLNKFISWIA